MENVACRLSERPSRKPQIGERELSPTKKCLKIIKLDGIKWALEHFHAAKSRRSRHVDTFNNPAKAPDEVLDLTGRSVYRLSGLFTQFLA
ncbi:hypothetical protein GCT13_04690 [Paraburkholderia sp. CNPSo 3157]|uniref:Uncharacterized protein n=1 Tax=Paraburkholderia franconis TaxID=2654983 RepID=A0A7X1TED8_9BURK|nr:hypothetical protein [Paraburkholderia franconis]MPW16243.1 hypothetical protein [Paraburkholderia franconis]